MRAGVVLRPARGQARVWSPGTRIHLGLPAPRLMPLGHRFPPSHGLGPCPFVPQAVSLKRFFPSLREAEVRGRDICGSVAFGSATPLQLSTRRDVGAIRWNPARIVRFAPNVPKGSVEKAKLSAGDKP